MRSSLRMAKEMQPIDKSPMPRDVLPQKEAAKKSFRRCVYITTTAPCRHTMFTIKRHTLAHTHLYTSTNLSMIAAFANARSRIQCTTARINSIHAGDAHYGSSDPLSPDLKSRLDVGTCASARILNSPRTSCSRKCLLYFKVTHGLRISGSYIASIEFGLAMRASLYEQDIVISVHPDDQRTLRGRKNRPIWGNML
jgi:hypothetical protein